MNLYAEIKTFYMENIAMSAILGDDFKKNREFFEKCESLSESHYDHIDSDRLILYVVNYLEENSVEPTFEKIVIAAYKLFPKRFSLLGFPEHPDAKTVYYPVMHCSYKKKGWLSGNMQSAFHLTSKGKEILNGVLAALSGEIPISKALSALPSRKEKFFLDLLESSSAFQKYNAGRADEISEMEIRIMLRTRTDTPSEILKQNLKKFFEYANIADRQKLVEFLEYVRKSPKWSHLFR
jgi:hypothetical protein